MSIDPALRDAWRGEHPCGVDRVVGFQGTLDDFMATGGEEGGRRRKTEEGGTLGDCLATSDALPSGDNDAGVARDKGVAGDTRAAGAAEVAGAAGAARAGDREAREKEGVGGRAVTHLVLLCVHSHARLIGPSSIHRIRYDWFNGLLELSSLYTALRKSQPIKFTFSVAKYVL